ncbi:peptidase [Methylophaga lonarensis MPL]|uniref:Peptidase n=1 Tax=Methylophaga lonarensis MPL TaxID=1286106 RepID=M7PET5_9GAMM|nr:peptidoglycan DD-metalloendopeptidase family protein [Methylophaga lonarensis]EMR12400.1 peptidase [Methylophaga lonarensis MPL]
MKKRNRLLNSSAGNRLFATSTRPKHHHFKTISFLALAGIFITSIVLATSEPSASNQTQVIELPNLNTAPEGSFQQAALPPQHQVFGLSQPRIQREAEKSQAESVSETTVQETEQDIAITESEQLEQLHLLEAAQLDTAESEIDVVSQTEKNIADPTLDWQEITVANGDNLSLIFPRVGLTARDVYNVAQTPGDIQALLNLRPGQTMRFGITKDDDAKLSVLELEISPLETLIVSAAESGYTAERSIRELETHQQQAAGEIQSSLFAAGIQAGMSDKLIMELAYVFGWDIDFALDIRKGDSFRVIYEEGYLDGNKISDGNILAAEFTNRGRTYRAIRFTDSDGHADYYTADGRSMRRAFNRTPVHFSRISSRFNPNRLHPVLGTNRPHRGVDYAAPTGTPIMATGNGRVESIGNQGGYGLTVVLSHGGKYTTLYAHMSRFKSGLKRGDRVRQGDVIGYVGMTGLATGPHLHYEFRVNGVHRDPLTVELPQAEPIADKYRQAFQQQAQPLLAKLDNLEIPALAALQQD